MKTILFQGDSITDAGRNRELPKDLGHGYPCLAASKIALSMPGCYRFYNRGISGDRIVDLYARLKRDIINLKPDYMSLLAGVNDVWHELDFSDGVSRERFKTLYRMLLHEVLTALPDIKIMLLEPYVMMGSATEVYFAELQSEILRRAEIVRELAEEFELPFIPLQEPLLKLSKETCSENFLEDGVHPKPAFHQYIADRWLEVFASWT
jgi:lysophospholipase L1-like esterase